jgi:hypothetical protein
MNHPSSDSRRQKAINPWRDEERGQTIVLIAFALIALVAFTGLTTDVALIYAAQRHLQRAVDAAALGAAHKLPHEAEARTAAYQYMALHGYSFHPEGNALTIAFPEFDPPRKVASVAGSIDVDLAFLRVIGLDQARVTVEGVGEAAPLDIYLVLDVSASMWYDTCDLGPPACWNLGPDDHCRPAGCQSTDWLCPDHTSGTCVARYCNQHKDCTEPGHVCCDPLDRHIRPAISYFLDILTPAAGVQTSDYDQVGLVIYDRVAQHLVSLTKDLQAVETAVNSQDAYEGGSSTNIGDAIALAHQHLSTEGRMDSVWSMILLTDGAPTFGRDCDGCALEECLADDASDNVCKRWARATAQTSWDNHEITIYTICYGDRCTDNGAYAHVKVLMRQIADITDNGVLDDPNGVSDNYWLVPDESGLNSTFREIADRIFTRLLR